MSETRAGYARERSQTCRTKRLFIRGRQEVERVTARELFRTSSEACLARTPTAAIAATATATTATATATAAAARARARATATSNYSSRPAATARPTLPTPKSSTVAPQHRAVTTFRHQPKQHTNTVDHSDTPTATATATNGPSPEQAM